MEESVMEKNTLTNFKVHRITRRKFLWVTSMSAAGALIGCAINPVTGEKQFMLMSKAQEIQVDKEYSPHQFSSDYGVLQDKALNNYVSQVGRNLVPNTHRKDMPYSFQGVNATYINAYAFPGGSIAATRGILLQLDNEAELAALIGHELGHVNARHSAEQMSKGTLLNAGMALASAYVATKYSQYAELAQTLGMLGASALLSFYSRDNEREADALGNEYMVKAGYSTNGFIGLMDMLNSLPKHQSGITDILFATHPMSNERYNTALNNAQKKYEASQGSPMYKERYMDNTSRLRAIKGAIDEMQKGETLMAQKKYSEAEGHFQTALRQVPSDYAGNLMMSKCLLAQNRSTEAERYADTAKQVNPGEAQAFHISGFAKIQRGRYDSAYQDFRRYEQMLPGNPNTSFFKGRALEGMQRKKAAAAEYRRYLHAVNQGPQAQHAYQQLVNWGVIKK